MTMTLDNPATSQSILTADAFEAAQKKTASGLAAYRQKAWEDFHRLSWPHRRDERWRFGNPQALVQENYPLASAPTAESIEVLCKRSELMSQTAARWVRIDGYPAHLDNLSAELVEQGVRLMTIAEAFENHPELIERTLGKPAPTLGSAKWEALARTHAGQGTFLYIPKNVVIEDPIALYHWAVTEKAVFFPQTVILAEAGARASIVEVYESAHPTITTFSIAATHAHLGCGARIFRKTLQLFNDKSHAIQIENAHLDKEADYNHVSVQLGCAYARFENQAFLEGEYSKAQLAALSLAHGNQVLDQRSLQVHKAANSTSDLLYKNALLDKSETIFSGLIVVEPGAQKTDAYQTNRNLLLSSEAEAIALPGLEIEANDVKCSHGATTAPIDAEEVFYLQSRGIFKQRAEELLAFGFFEEVINRVAEPTLADNLRSVVQSKFRNRLS